jgi:hypothetical protein
MDDNSNLDIDQTNLEQVTQRFINSEQKIENGIKDEQDLIDLDNAYQAYVTARTDNSTKQPKRTLIQLFKEIGR